VKEEHGLRVLENRMLVRIFGPKGDKVTGEWKKLHKRNLISVFLTQSCSDDQIEKNEICRTLARIEKTKGVYRVLVGET
jgi:hypothetical protein